MRTEKDDTFSLIHPFMLVKKRNFDKEKVEYILYPCKKKKAIMHVKT